MSTADPPLSAGGPPLPAAGMGVPGSPAEPETQASATFDPLRLCIFATVALLGWALGPFALLWFAGMGFLGYARARRDGLTRSRCLLRDTRLVLLYLALLLAAAAVGIWSLLTGWLR